MRLQGFLEMLDSSNEYKELLNKINDGLLPVNLLGVSQSAAAHLVFCLSNKAQQPSLVVVPDGITAKNLAADLKLFLGDNVLLFPERELIFYDIDAQAKDIITERLLVLHSLVKGKVKVVVSTIAALMGATAPRHIFDNINSHKTGGILDVGVAAQNFVNLGYVREDIVEGKGQYAIRGGIVDFFPHTSDNPIRIELFADEIDSIREFDPITQRSLNNTTFAEVTPAGEITIDSAKKTNIIANIKALYNDKNKKFEKSLDRDIERLENNIYFPSIDKYLPFIYDEMPTLTDYFKEKSQIFIYEPARVSESAKNIDWRLSEQALDFAEKGILPLTDKQWHKNYYDVMRKFLHHKVIGLMGISYSSPDYDAEAKISLNVKQQGSFHGKIDLFFDAIRFYKRSKYSVIIFGGSAVKAKNITEELNSENIPAVYQSSVDMPYDKGQIIVTHGEITQGLEYPALKLAIIGDKEIFGQDKKPSKRFKKGNLGKVINFTDLSAGDYVVHQNHGIGQFSGIKTMEVDGATSDYLQIKFRGNDILYVPTNQLDLVYKHSGGDMAGVRLNKLGGTEWHKTKQKVTESARDMALQLIKLYAARQSVRGISFTANDDWNSSFAATFPYEETEDQLRSFDEVSADMEKAHPMDRLLCGDVGYGKTEVALRAAFKAVMDGYQVAYLVPTTILATQHFNTFTDRMKDFPIEVDMLSRFRTHREQKETVKRTKAGEVDIVIGTHRLLQKDLMFKKLGLLIIDEEQRFGVAHKEYLKELKSNVDVLTLSATPIPRTLHMSLSGIRDMSVLENPPKNRYPVNTFVLEYNAEILEEAIIREIARGGQVYYLHNRVETIEKVAMRIAEISSDIRVGVAHGKMGENALEDIMQQVLNGKIDVLVCTTIIETGLDIPNINTIIVEDADKMGLAQLYQLRGRVGRSSRLAYAYLTYRRGKVLSELSEKRLRAIRDFTEFGSGFKIALRDLEIRGAGNVLGAHQHGHMDAVGYDMYCKLLSDAVSKLKGMEDIPDIQTVISLNIDAFIPKDYIHSENYRIEIYKKIASIENEEDYLDVFDEIQDRYGDLPTAVKNLIDIALIRNYAAFSGIEEVRQTATGVIFTLSSKTPYDFEAVTKLMAMHDKKILFSATAKPYITLRSDGKNLLRNVKTLLQEYKELKNVAK
ncbi:MAG: transcription-repair coupling factor [Firmicutes bacterium]|nr:transcription-repair coupling factor [Bacillota bacterium]